VSQVEVARCAQFAAILQDALDGDEPSASAVDAHAAHCLACHGDLVRYRRLVRLLGELRDERMQLPPGLLADVLEAVGSAAERRALRSVLGGRRTAYVAGVVAASAAVSLLLLVARARARQRGGRAELRGRA
jgi:predicted anti-sigma-YlaC factor YlaD